jgi:hypothetical protein
MVELQLVTGMRPGEVIAMRPRDIDRTTRPWQYKPAHHKTLHHGHDRVVFLGKKAQAIITPYLLRPEDKPLFSPAEAEKQRREAIHEQRVQTNSTPLSCGNIPGLRGMGRASSELASRRAAQWISGSVTRSRSLNCPSSMTSPTANARSGRFQG